MKLCNWTYPAQIHHYCNIAAPSHDRPKIQIINMNARNKAPAFLISVSFSVITVLISYSVKCTISNSGFSVVNSCPCERPYSDHLCPSPLGKVALVTLPKSQKHHIRNDADAFYLTTRTFFHNSIFARFNTFAYQAKLTYHERHYHYKQ